MDPFGEIEKRIPNPRVKITLERKSGTWILGSSFPILSLFGLSIETLMATPSYMKTHV